MNISIVSERERKNTKNLDILALFFYKGEIDKIKIPTIDFNETY